MKDVTNICIGLTSIISPAVSLAPRVWPLVMRWIRVREVRAFCRGTVSMEGNVPPATKKAIPVRQLLCKQV